MKFSISHFSVTLGRVRNEIELLKPGLPERTGFSYTFSIEDNLTSTEFFSESISRINREILAKVDAFVFVSSGSELECPGEVAGIARLSGISAAASLFEIRDACNGFLTGLELAGTLVNSGTKTSVLLVIGDVYDRKIRADSKADGLFSDAVTVVVVSPFSEGTDGNETWDFEILHSVSDPDFKKALYIHHEPSNSEAILKMNGPAVFSWVVEKSSQLIEDLTFRGVQINEFDDVLVHQGSRKVVETVQTRIGWRGKGLFRAGNYGNAVGSSVAKLLLDCSQSSRDKNFLIITFGMGMTMRAASLVRRMKVMDSEN